jgi:6-pyruvoyltetrahydropterin/6-carboxytetrahydropterin synthase
VFAVDGSPLVGDEEMYRLRVQSRFDAAHKLVGYEGKCSRLHGHTWNVEVFVIGEDLDKTGILLDFRTLKEKVKEITKRLDHSYINELEEIGNPTSENIARYIYQNLSGLPANIRLEKVRVWESPDSWSEYLQS